MPNKRVSWLFLRAFLWTAGAQSARAWPGLHGCLAIRIVGVREVFRFSHAVDVHGFKLQAGLQALLVRWGIMVLIGDVICEGRAFLPHGPLFGGC